MEKGDYVFFNRGIGVDLSEQDRLNLLYLCIKKYGISNQCLLGEFDRLWKELLRYPIHKLWGSRAIIIGFLPQFRCLIQLSDNSLLSVGKEYLIPIVVNKQGNLCSYYIDESNWDVWYESA